MAKQNRRADHHGAQRVTYEKNRRRILASQDVCGICGKPVDKTLPASHPLSATVDHIIPLQKGGHPSSMDNLQLAHRACNRAKGTKMPTGKTPPEIIDNRNLPWSRNWLEYRAGDDE